MHPWSLRVEISLKSRPNTPRFESISRRLTCQIGMTSAPIARSGYYCAFANAPIANQYDTQGGIPCHRKDLPVACRGPATAQARMQRRRAKKHGGAVVMAKLFKKAK
jgi:hypothetical protein